MADVMTLEQRRRCMSHIKAKNTKPEIILRKALWSIGLRYRVHSKLLVGKPDVVFIRKRVVIFIDGCFWHGCPLHSTTPNTNHSFWAEKLRKNAQRDQEVSRKLTALGWTVCRFWEHEINEDVGGVVSQILKALGDK